MVKKKEGELDSTDNSIASPKRQRRPLKPKRSYDYDSDVLDIVNDITITNSSVSTIDTSCNDKYKPQENISTKSQKKKRTKGKESETSSEEERWLDAIESGKLEEVDDELKKIKDPKLMTARQRAMYERSSDKGMSPSGEMLMSLPTGYKEKVLTAEAIQKAQLKSQKRKQLADEKREKDKKKTMDRLLKKQETKLIKQIKYKVPRSTHPVISYKNSLHGSTITMPLSMEFPLKAQYGRDPPKPVLCSIPGCSNIKSYNCSKTNVPLCSFSCYKKNVDSLKQIMC